jgi:hypothetical protein
MSIASPQENYDMRLFLSWSGERSRRLAQEFHQWIGDVIQTCEPWLSSDDVEKGTRWFGEISTSIAESNFGVIFLTQENKNRPWLLFEAGALAKNMEESRVFTLLVDLDNADIDQPLASFNHTKVEKEDLFLMVREINAKVSTPPLSDQNLRRSFDRLWPELHKKYLEILKETASVAAVKPVKRDSSEMLSEILETTRGFARQMQTLEDALVPKGSNLGHLATQTYLPPSSLGSQAQEAWERAESEHMRKLQKLAGLMGASPVELQEILNKHATVEATGSRDRNQIAGRWKRARPVDQPRPRGASEAQEGGGSEEL